MPQGLGLRCSRTEMPCLPHPHGLLFSDRPAPGLIAHEVPLPRPPTSGHHPALVTCLLRSALTTNWSHPVLSALVASACAH